MKRLFNLFRAWWNEDPVLLNAPKDWAAAGKMDCVIQCPICHEKWNILTYIPIGAQQATVVCGNGLCREQMEVYPDRYFGWKKPRVEWREKSFA